MVLIKIISFIIYLSTALIADIKVVNNSGSNKSSYIKTLKGEKRFLHLLGILALLFHLDYMKRRA